MGALIVIAVLLAADEVVPEPSAPPEPPPVARTPLDAAPEQPVAPAPVEVPNPLWQPARGSAKGPWAFVEASGWLGSGTFVNPDLYGFGGLQNGIVAGWGFEVDTLRFVPSIGFAWGVQLFEQADFAWTPISVRLAMPDLFYEKWLTMIRVTLLVGLTIPTNELRLTPYTTGTFALQLERRFGPVEVAYRVEGGRSFVELLTGAPRQQNTWLLTNRFFVEGFILEWLSVAFGFGVLSSWSDAINDGGVPATSPAAHRDLFNTTVQINVALTRFVGLNLGMDNTMPALDPAGRPRFPFYAFGAATMNYATFELRFWVRTDPQIQRNWLDR